MYEFDVEVSNNFPEAAAPEDIVNVKVAGTDAQTYQELVPSAKTKTGG